MTTSWLRSPHDGGTPQRGCKDESAVLGDRNILTSMVALKRSAILLAARKRSLRESLLFSLDHASIVPAVICIGCLPRSPGARAVKRERGAAGQGASACCRASA